MNRREAIQATAALVGAAAASSVTIAAAADLASPWRVFRVSGCEWYAARSALEALQAAAGDWGCKDAAAELGALLEDLAKEGLADEEPQEADLDALRFADCDENGDLIEDEDGAPLPARTFREELARRVDAGLEAPELFAVAEW